MSEDLLHDIKLSIMKAISFIRARLDEENVPNPNEHKIRLLNKTLEDLVDAKHKIKIFCERFYNLNNRDGRKD